MKIGVCTSPDKMQLVAELGYDYIEPNFSWMTGLDDQAFAEMTAMVQASPIKAESFCIFFPGGSKLYALDGNQEPLLESIAAFAEKGFSRAAMWGGKVAVIGSGYVRGIPEGMTKEETARQFAKVLAVLGEIASRHGMRIVVEPLSRRECNFIHTVKEGAAVADLSGHPAVGTLVDFYHFWNNEEDMSTLPAYADQLFHAHFARRGDRLAPSAEDEETLKQVASVLTRCPNIERISLECNWKPDFDTAIRDARPFMEILKTV